MNKLLIAIVLFIALGFTAAPTQAANWGCSIPTPVSPEKACGGGVTIQPHSSWSTKRPLGLDKQLQPSDFAHYVKFRR